MKLPKELQGKVYVPSRDEAERPVEIQVAREGFEDNHFEGEVQILDGED
jgi:hypothetical protein